MNSQTLIISSVILLASILTVMAAGGTTVLYSQQKNTGNSVLALQSTAKITNIANAYSNVSNSSRASNQNSSSLQPNSHSQLIRVAFVRPTFTYAAYQMNGFYNFYHKYEHVDKAANVTTDLNLLTVKVPHGPVLSYGDDPNDRPSLPRETRYIQTLMQAVQNNTAAALHGRPIKISDITDKDVHDGLIFSRNGSNSNNNTNAYDVLFLFHQEYVTSAEYHNLKKFVQNGGTVVFNDANVLTTEVSYDNKNNTVTLVEGHNWKYDGNHAVRGEPERWANDTREWVGSNFMQDPTRENVTFGNNPFGYKHSEEQFVSNPKDKIIFNFGAREFEPITKDEPQKNKTVAIYELSYGKGKVIMLSIFSYKLVDSDGFLDYYNKQIIPRALAINMPVV